MKLLITELDNIICNENGSLYDDAVGFLKAAHERCFTVILTNHPLKSTQDRVGRLGISDYIDLVVSATEYEMPKPDPRMINVLLALLNTEGKKFGKSDVIIVGDRPSLDVKFGNKAGVQTIRMRRGKFSAEEPEYTEESAKIEVKNLTELAASIGIQIKKEEIEIPAKAVQDDLSHSFGLDEAEPRKDDLSSDFDIVLKKKEELAAIDRKISPRKKAKRRSARKPKARSKPKPKGPRLGFFGI